MAIGGISNQGTRANVVSSGSNAITSLQPIAAGDLCIYALMTQSGRTISGSPAGFTGVTWLGSQQTFGNNKVLSIRYGVATVPIADGTVLIATLSGGSINGAVLQSISGVDPTTPLDTQGAGATADGTAPGFADAGAHAVANAIGFGATFVVDGESRALTIDPAWSNGYQLPVSSLGMLSLSSRIVSTTAAITRTESISGDVLTWASNTYWFRDDGLAAPVSSGGLLLKGVG